MQTPKYKIGKITQIIYATLKNKYIKAKYSYENTLRIYKYKNKKF